MPKVAYLFPGQGAQVMGRRAGDRFGEGEVIGRLGPGEVEGGEELLRHRQVTASLGGAADQGGGAAEVLGRISDARVLTQAKAEDVVVVGHGIDFAAAWLWERKHWRASRQWHPIVLSSR